MLFVKKIISYIFIIGIFIIPLFVNKSAFAMKFDLIPPEGELKRGQEIQFTITINTDNVAVNNATIGMTYDTTALEYVSSTPGDSFAEISVTPQDGGKIVFSGTNNSGYNGQGNFALVKFKIIAAASGSTELCVLWAPSPTTQPTAGPTSVPKVTTLPKTGDTDTPNQLIFFSVIFFVITGGLMIQNFRSSYIPHHPPSKHKKLHK